MTNHSLGGIIYSQGKERPEYKERGKGNGEKEKIQQGTLDTSLAGFNNRIVALNHRQNDRVTRGEKSPHGYYKIFFCYCQVRICSI